MKKLIALILSIGLILTLLPLCNCSIRAEETSDYETVTQTQNEEKTVKVMVR